MAKIVTATWTDPTPTTYVDHLEVWRKTGSSGTYTKISGNIILGTETYVDSSALIDGETYYYNVRAYNSSGGFNSIEANITISMYLLDSYPNAKVAYSLRQLKTGVTNVIQVRRSDDATQDFTPTQITDGTLTTWVGAGNNGYIKTWYDQSGNGKDIATSTQSYEPVIVLSGSLIIKNGKPSVSYREDHYSKLYIEENLFPTNLWTFTTVFDIDVTDKVSQTIVSQHSSAADDGRTTPIAFVSTDLKQVGYINNAGSGVNYIYSTDITTGQHLVSTISNHNDAKTKIDNGSLETVTSGLGNISTPVAYFVIGNLGGTSQNCVDGGIQEVIGWDSDLTSDLTGIENEVNTYYSIY